MNPGIGSFVFCNVNKYFKWEKEVSLKDDPGKHGMRKLELIRKKESRQGHS